MTWHEARTRGCKNIPLLTRPIVSVSIVLVDIFVEGRRRKGPFVIRFFERAWKAEKLSLSRCSTLALSTSVARRLLCDADFGVCDVATVRGGVEGTGTLELEAMTGESERGSRKVGRSAFEIRCTTNSLRLIRKHALIATRLSSHYC